VLAALIIVFREVFEAGLIVGIVLAVTRGVRHRGWWIGGGVLGGVLGACIVAAFAGALAAAFAGAGQELFNATILGVAAAMLTWHNVWMARHGRALAAEMRSVGEAVAAGSKSLAGLAVVVAVAVLREGFEVVLFLYGVVVSSEAGSGLGIFAGGIVGLVLAAAVCFLTYRGFLSIPSRHLFSVTSALIGLLAAGMAAQATAFLEQADVVTALPRVVWDSSSILPDTSIIGRALHTLIGYSDRPTAMELTVYAAVLATIVLLMRALAPPRRPPAAAEARLSQRGRAA
jgi:high-affinity iron transporter